jgi:response regulator RpfG family c-di-GMP phosphodiesterase
MALADVFDALVSKRCYKDAFSYDEAFQIMEESMGQHFDPELGKVFMECRRELEAFYDENK